MDSNFPMPELNDFVRQTLDVWHVPGAAVAVVKDGQVVASEGLGLRDVENSLPATARTLFPIASCTKAFTAMCVALLVDEGKLEWDKPVRHWLPAFKLHDPHATELITPRDLLCHRSGLPRHDTVWYASNFNRKQVVDRLRYLEPSAGFRQTWQYQNMMYVTAGYLAGEVNGTTWEEMVRQRIFEPLGMARSNTSTTITQQDPDHARPYLYRKGELRHLPFYQADETISTGPAGAIVSSVEELARWLTVHLCGGRLDGRQFVSAHNLAEMHKPHIFIDDPQLRERFGIEFLSYGLGWFLRSYKGQMLISHGGNIDGFSSLVSFMPRHNVGVVVLSNGDGAHNSLPEALTFTIYDRLVGLPATDWNGKLKQMVDELLAGWDKSKEQSTEQRRAAPPSHPLEDYVGEYEHDGYGIYTVRRAAQGEGLEVVANDKIVMPLAPYHYDVFEATWEQLDERLKLLFRTDVQGNIDGFSWQAEPMVEEVYFKRLAGRQFADPAVLARFVGEYELLGLALAVRLQDGRLIATLPDQEFELVPYRGSEFTLKGMAGHRIAFKADEAGAFNEAIVTQPGAVFTARRKKQ